nr:MAG TPA: hypothetical protein [Caudoviricetes sp.]
MFSSKLELLIIYLSPGFNSFLYKIFLQDDATNLPVGPLSDSS